MGKRVGTLDVMLKSMQWLHHPADAIKKSSCYSISYSLRANECETEITTVNRCIFKAGSKQTETLFADCQENFQKLVPTLGGQMMDVGGHVYGQTVSRIGRHGQAPIPPPKPGSLAKGVSAGGAGGTTGVGGSIFGTGGAKGLAGGAGGEGLEEKGKGDSQQDHGMFKRTHKQMTPGSPVLPRSHYLPSAP